MERKTIAIAGALLLAVLADGCGLWPRAGGASRIPSTGDVGDEQQPARSGEPGPNGSQSASLLQPRLTDAQKQAALDRALQSLVRVAVVPDEVVLLADGSDPTAAAREMLTATLSEKGYTVVEARGELGIQSTDEQQDKFRDDNRCNLVFLVSGSSNQKDKFGSFFLFEAHLSVKVLDLAAHEVIASKQSSKAGQRELDEAIAARTAASAAAEELVASLADEIAAREQATSLVRLSLVVASRQPAQQALGLRHELHKRPGIYYVSLENWQEADHTATYEILCRLDIQEQLGSWVEELSDPAIEMIDLKQTGDTIQARQGVAK